MLFKLLKTILPYCHSYDKVGSSLLETTNTGHEECGEVGYQSLDNEDDGDYGKLR